MLKNAIILSVLIVIILLIRLLFRRSVSPRLIYALWIAVVIKLLIPFSPIEINVEKEIFVDPPVSSINDSTVNQPEIPVSPGNVSGSQVLIPITPTPQSPSGSFTGDTEIPGVVIPSNPELSDVPENNVTPGVSDEPDVNIGDIISHPQNNSDSQEIIDPIDKIDDSGKENPNLTDGLISAANKIRVIVSCVIGATFILSGIAFTLSVRRDRVFFKRINNVNVYISKNVHSPCLSGIIPAIYLTPSSLEAKSPAMIIIHEYTHLRHLDNIWSLIRLAAIAVYWWNPFVWIAAYVSKQDAELACDDTVSAKLNERQRLDYAGIIIDTIPRKNSLFMQTDAIGLGSGSIKERITMLTKKNNHKLILAIIAVLLSLCAVGCSLIDINESEKIVYNDPAGENNESGVDDSNDPDPDDPANNDKVTTQYMSHKIYHCDDVYIDADTLSYGDSMIELQFPGDAENYSIIDCQTLLCDDGCDPKALFNRAHWGYAPAYEIYQYGIYGADDGWNYPTLNYFNVVPDDYLENIAEAEREAFKEKSRRQYMYLIELGHNLYSVITLAPSDTSGEKPANEEEVMNSIIANIKITANRTDLPEGIPSDATEEGLEYMLCPLEWFDEGDTIEEKCGKTFLDSAKANAAAVTFADIDHDGEIEAVWTSGVHMVDKVRQSHYYKLIDGQMYQVTIPMKTGQISEICAEYFEETDSIALYYVKNGISEMFAANAVIYGDTVYKWGKNAYTSNIFDGLYSHKVLPIDMSILAEKSWYYYTDLGEEPYNSGVSVDCFSFDTENKTMQYKSGLMYSEWGLAYEGPYMIDSNGLITATLTEARSGKTAKISLMVHIFPNMKYNIGYTEYARITVTSSDSEDFNGLVGKALVYTTSEHIMFRGIDNVYNKENVPEVINGYRTKVHSVDFTGDGVLDTVITNVLGSGTGILQEDIYAVNGKTGEPISFPDPIEFLNDNVVFGANEYAFTITYGNRTYYIAKDCLGTDPTILFDKLGYEPFCNYTVSDVFINCPINLFLSPAGIPGTINIYHRYSETTGQFEITDVKYYSNNKTTCSYTDTYYADFTSDGVEESYTFTYRENYDPETNLHTFEMDNWVDVKNGRTGDSIIVSNPTSFVYEYTNLETTDSDYIITLGKQNLTKYTIPKIKDPANPSETYDFLCYGSENYSVENGCLISCKDILCKKDVFSDGPYEGVGYFELKYQYIAGELVVSSFGFQDYSGKYTIKHILTENDFDPLSVLGSFPTGDRIFLFHDKIFMNNVYLYFYTYPTLSLPSDQAERHTFNVYYHVAGSSSVGILNIHFPESVDYDTATPVYSGGGGGSGECEFIVKLTKGNKTWYVSFDNFDYVETVLEFKYRGEVDDKRIAELRSYGYIIDYDTDESVLRCQSVLRNHLPMYTFDQPEGIGLDRWLDYNGYTLEKYAIIDLDGDGQSEMVLEISCGNFLILYYKDNKVYALPEPYRTFNNLKADGTFSWDLGGSISGIGKLDLSRNDDRIIKIAYYRVDYENNVTLYYIENREVSKADYENYVVNQSKKPDAAWRWSLDTSEINDAISSVLKDKYRSEYPDGLIHVESYCLLDIETEGVAKAFANTENFDEVTVYLIVYHTKYAVNEGQIEEVEGDFVPTAITFTIDKNGEYTLKNYWTPRNDSNYESDIRTVFPEDAANNALNTQKYAGALTNDSWTKVVAYLDSLQKNN
ncbi:MAG: M56 family metallopeptidase [Ruminococcaceae bacterium]|nr:M56 family metallopeptidase [Oscillospiraceae bacterium]